MCMLFIFTTKVVCQYYVDQINQYLLLSEVSLISLQCITYQVKIISLHTRVMRLQRWSTTAFI